MKPLSSILILTVVVFASACSKGNYAQVEPSESYYSQGINNYGQPALSASADATGGYDANYQSQHSPVLTSNTLGSPTVQQNEETFYNASYNPDLAGKNLSGPGSAYNYYIQDYGTQDLVSTDVVPLTNNYFYHGNSPYYSNLYPIGSYFSMPFYFSNYYSLRPWYDPFNPYFNLYSNGFGMYSGSLYTSGIGYFGLPGYLNTFYSINYYSGIYDSNGTGYFSGYNGYSTSAYNYYGNPNNSSYAVYGSEIGDDSYGGRITNGSPISRSSVSHYANSGKKIQRREDSSPRDNKGGRIADNNSRNRTKSTSVTSKRGSEKGSITRTAADYTRNTYRKQPVGSSSMTLQRNDNARRRTIVKVNGNSRQNTGIKSNSNKRNRSNNYTGRSNTRQNIVSNRSNQSRYSSHSGTTRTVGTANRNRTNTSYNRTRSSSQNRSYSAPRSGMSNRSAAPRSGSVQRSSSQRSSSGGTRSTGSRGPGRKN